MDATNLNEPLFGPGFPIFPGVLELVRVPASSMGGSSSSFSGSIAVPYRLAYLQQWTSTGPRDRVAVYLADPGGTPGAGYHLARLVYNIYGLPLYVTACCTPGGEPPGRFTISTTTSNFDPGDFSTLLLNVTANTSLTGVVSPDPEASSTLTFINTGTGTLTIPSLDPSTPFNYRILTPGGLPVPIGPGDSFTLVYDPVQNYWRLIQQPPVKLYGSLTLPYPIITQTSVPADSVLTSSQFLLYDINTFNNPGIGYKAKDSAGNVQTGTLLTSNNSWNLVKKKVDQPKTTDTTLAKDEQLLFSMAANTTYAVRGKIFYTAGAGAFQYQWEGPAAPTLLYLRHSYQDPGASPATPTVDTAYNIATTMAAGNGGFIEIDAIVQNGANVDAFAFAWAQFSSDAAATTVNAGSYLEYWAYP